MTLCEVCRRFNLSADKINYYEKESLLRHQTDNNGEADYSQADLKRIALLNLLCKIGIDDEDLKKYFRIDGNSPEFKQEQVKVLRRQRYKLLDNIHEKQQLLDQLDYLIKTIKNTDIR